MSIPCGENDHWKYIDLLVFWALDDLEPQSLADELDTEELSSGVVIQDKEGPGWHTHARLRRATMPEPAEAADDEPTAAWMLRLSTYRYPAEQDRNYLELAQVLDAVRSCTTADEWFVAAEVHLVFSAEEAEWRPSLLARPPELTELKEDLGRIVLSGLSLRFEESTQGLVEADLDVSATGKSYRTALRFSVVVSKETAQDLYSIVLTKAERFASLFLEFQAHG